MLRSLENLEFIKSDANGLEIQMGSQGKMIEMLLYFQTFQFEKGVQNGEDMIVLGHHSAHRCFSQSGILFERFMEDFHRPSFLIGR